MEQGRSLRRAAMLTACVGGIHALLFLLSYWLVSDVPGASASDAEIAEFYKSGETWRIILSGFYVGPFAGMAFIWFLVALRMWVDSSARRANVLLSNIQLVAGIVYVALLFAAFAASSVLAASAEFADGEIDAVAARQFPQYGDTLLFVFTFRMAAMFVFTTSAIGRASGILPRPFVWSGYAVGLFPASQCRLRSLVRPRVPVLADCPGGHPARTCPTHTSRARAPCAWAVTNRATATARPRTAPVGRSSARHSH
jgi:hypothetical protein